MRKSIQSLLLFLVAFLFLSYDNPNLPPVYLPQGYHVMKSLSASGDTCQLENGSVWEISLSDSQTLFTWQITDPLTIYPHRGWFSSYEYEIVNQATNTSVLANLKFLSESDEEYTNRIASLNPYQGEVILENGTRWFLDFSDQNIYSEWLLGDAIIIGSNKAGFFSSDKYILINVYTNNYVRASQE